MKRSYRPGGFQVKWDDWGKWESVYPVNYHFTVPDESPGTFRLVPKPRAEKTVSIAWLKGQGFTEWGAKEYLMKYATLVIIHKMQYHRFKPRRWAFG